MLSNLFYYYGFRICTSTPLRLPPRHVQWRVCLRRPSVTCKKVVQGDGHGCALCCLRPPAVTPPTTYRCSPHPSSMGARSVVASSGINIGLALLILSLFSLLKKRPSNDVVYLPRRHPLPPSPPSPLHRLSPSFSWIPRALRISEDDILFCSGLDALRLFKLGALSPFPFAKISDLVVACFVRSIFDL